MRHTAYISTEAKNSAVSFWLRVTETAGIAAGAFAAIFFHLPEKLCGSVCPALYGGTLLDVFAGTFLMSLVFLTAAFFSGLSAFGQVSAVVLTAAIGAELGASAAVIYSGRGISALPAVMVLFVPKALAISAVYLLAARESFRSSMAILRGITGGETEGVSLRLSIIKYVVLIIISLIISAADTLLNYFFAGLV